MITVQKVDGTTAQIGGRQINAASIVNAQAVADFVVDTAACAVVAATIARVAHGDHVVIRNMAAAASHDMYFPNSATGHAIRQKIRNVIKDMVR
jgi:phosphosulfolactate phosphohydrolase-like enzyme